MRSPDGLPSARPPWRRSRNPARRPTGREPSHDLLAHRLPLTHEPRRRPGKCPSTARRQGCQRPPGGPTTPRSPQWFPGKSLPGRGSQTLTLREGPWALHLSFQKVRDATNLPKLRGGAALSGAPRPPEPRLIRQTHRPNPQGHADPTQTHSTATQPPQGSPRPGPNLHPLHKYGRNPTVGPGKVRGVALSHGHSGVVAAAR